MGSFAASHPPRLVRAIADELKIQDYSAIVGWELELFDLQPAQVGGLDKEFIFGSRIDDMLCSWAAIEGLLASKDTEDSRVIKLVGVLGDEDVGSQPRQGAAESFLHSTISRVCDVLGDNGANILHQTYANSFLITADVTCAESPSFLDSYPGNHMPRLNTGMAICASANSHMTLDPISTAFLARIAEKTGSRLQFSTALSDWRRSLAGGPMLSSAMGVRAIDVGIPQLSTHGISAPTGSLDPGLGVQLLAGFFLHFESVGREFGFLDYLEP
jgi:aminopeptidase I